ncbi:MAG TPA: Crp/Fnr family transcriptional regulator [Bacteroidales bacterium]|nr:Crp/Fnr family transcriptional regulator [Bacteroidales bacterium]
MSEPNLCIAECLEGENSLFKGLTQKEKELISQHHSFRIVKRGGYLFREGERISGLISLISGKVKVFKNGPGGREQILRLVKKNGLIGYESLFSDNKLTMSARAIEESALCIFEINAITKIIKKNPELSYRLLKVMAEELNTSGHRMVSLTQKHVRGRIAESLLMLGQIYGYEADGKTIGVSLSRQDIANLSNMTTSNAIRTLSSMASEGNIKINGRKISILEASSLEQMSRCC